jgi:hypothetical protein
MINRNNMLSLNLPPVAEAREIVLDMMPTITPDADPGTIQRSVELAENLLSLCNLALEHPTTEAVLKNLLGGIVAAKTDTDASDHLRSALPPDWVRLAKSWLH